MTDLVSPGVSVTITDDTIGSASATGTVPLFIIATAQDKLISSSSTVATGTTAANANTLQLLSSQTNVLSTFGTPVFQTSDGNVVQGDELNEYGLHALYSYMGIANSAYAVRANIDLNQLAPTGTEPTGTVTSGTLWLDTSVSQVEAFVPVSFSSMSGRTSTKTYRDWVAKTVHFVNIDADLFNAGNFKSVDTSSISARDIVIFCVDGNTTSDVLHVYTYQNGSTFIQADVILSSINKVPVVEAYDSAGTLEGNPVWIRDGFTKNGSNYYGTRFVVKRYAATTSVWTVVDTFTGNDFYSVESKSGSFGTSYIASVLDSTTNSFSFFKQSEANPVQSQAVPMNVGVMMQADQVLKISFLATSVSVTLVSKGDTPTTSSILKILNTNESLANAGFKFDSSSDSLVITNDNGYSFAVSSTSTQLFNNASLLSTDGAINYAELVGSNFDVSSTAPTGTAPTGTYWYNFSNTDSLTVSLYTADVETNEWVAVKSSDMYVELDEPDIDRDFWVQPITQGTDGYVFYRLVDSAWTKLDTTDQSTVNGVLFGDMTYAKDVAAAELYQNEMLLVDYGSTEGVVLQKTATSWEVVSGAANDGSGLFGRDAQRKVIVEALSAVITGNDDIRSEYISYNLICCPGYVEVLSDLVTLNTDRRETAFIVTDVPARLQPTATNVQAWATNSNNVAVDGENGRVTAYDYAAQYMGWCYGTNVDGNSIAVPGSTVAMRTIAYSDSVSYPWYPPAGTSRGVVSNASSVGYVNDENEYVSVVYSQGQRDAIYTNNINPIAMRPNRGLLVYGDKTLASDSTSALSRVNVARMVCYVRKQIEYLAEPYLFELNTAVTRKAFASSVTTFLASLVQTNALEDFTVVCDSSNNTTARIDANQLWMDIAIVPTRSINFIYVPIRLENSIS